MRPLEFLTETRPGRRFLLVRTLLTCLARRRYGEMGWREDVETLFGEEAAWGGGRAAAHAGGLGAPREVHPRGPQVRAAMARRWKDGGVQGALGAEGTEAVTELGVTVGVDHGQTLDCILAYVALHGLEFA